MFYEVPFLNFFISYDSQFYDFELYKFIYHKEINNFKTIDFHSPTKIETFKLEPRSLNSNYFINKHLYELPDLIFQVLCDKCPSIVASLSNLKL